MADLVTPPAPHEDTSARDVLLEVERSIALLHQHVDPRVGELVAQLLADIDAVHRAGLTHLMSAIRGMGGDAFVNRLIADPAIRMLLMSYDLVAVDRRLMAEEAIDTVRGHLHAHGVDVEILEVVGGVVYVRLHGMAAGALPLEAVARDLEETLRASFVGFQELVTKERTTRATAIQVDLRRAHRPVYREVLDESALAAGESRAIDLDDRPMLIVRTATEWLAMANRCGDTPLPLQFSRIDGTTLHCSWHGCQYDVRTGMRLDVPGERVAVFPVSVDHGKVRVAVNVERA
ncbi:MAG TPA: Rieske 2Fe-2S domain-containing protein [Vicinamibacterales bacterium]|nr:Rieske 2Fe-2S domain-containing protein [Vicinamibacterales bacterium]